MLSTLLLVVAVAGCQDSKPDQQASHQPVVAIGSDTLYEKTLNRMFEGIQGKAADSEALRQSQIDRWVRKKLMYQRALDQLTPAQKDQDQALQQYYESLIRHTYKKQLLKDQLDRTFSTDTLMAYYQAHKDRFTLERPILKLRYLAVPDTTPGQQKLDGWFRSSRNYHLDSLYRYARRHARHFSLDNEEWHHYHKLKDRFQLPDGPEAILQQNTTHRGRLDSTTNLHLAVQEYQRKNTTAPFALKRQQIRKTLLNQRKQTLIDGMEQQILQEARQQNQVYRYD